VNPNTGAYLQQATPGTNPSVVVEWGDRDFSPPRNFIGGYIVYRAQSQNFAAVVSEAIGAVPGSGQRNFSDDPNWAEINTTIPVRFTQQEGTETIDVREDIDVTIVHQSVQPGQTYFYKVRRLGPASVIIPPTLIDTSGTNSGGGGGGGFGGGGGGFGGGGGGGFGFRSRQAGLPKLKRGEMLLQTGGNIIVRRHPRVIIGRHRQVSTIPPGPQYDPTLDPTVDNEIDTSEDIALSNASGAVGPVTYIVPPDPRAPSDNNQAQRVDDIAFQWQGQFGATDYVIQISRNVNFTPLVFESSPISNTSAALMNFRYNNTVSGFVELSPNTTYFWRVGARSTQGNQAAPRPFGYVFSRVSTFSTADQPPVAP
ncbi:MAG: fibronectin type III domain-containing protein, partial [Armatimonadetes bacterium]|nr:fibronectin type III domain-containing protein [Armatimonadota bacterium]